MRNPLWTGLAASLLLARVVGAHEAAFKSPASGMHFSQGQPVIVFADLFDSNNEHGIIACPGGQTAGNPPGGGQATCSGGGTPTGWPQMQVLVDGVVQTDSVTGQATVPGTTVFNEQMNPDPVDFYRFSVTGLAPGVHEMRIRGHYAPPPDSDGSTLDSASITITIDPLPSGRTVLELGADANGAIDWQDRIVFGHGHHVDPAGAAVVIRNSLVIGLGNEQTPGIAGAAASVDIEQSVFEATAALDLTIAGTALVRGSEFRANNLLHFEASDPDASPIVTLRGNGAAQKTFQGNRIGAGRLVFSNTRHWLIGGDGDAQVNILIGPRATMYLVDGSSDMVVRGNYDHHNYRGGWSQGFNLAFTCNECSGASGGGILVEHNLIRGGSWPLQDLTGEFRYNLVYGYGHTWLRSANDGASIHHNVFAPEKGGGDLNQGVWFYGGETGITLYNNTFDGGGPHGDFAGPTIEVDNASRVTSLRNNLVTYSRDYDNGSPGLARIVGASANFVSVDYNAFHSPDNSTHDNYAITGWTEGTTPGFAAHDVSGTGAIGVRDGQLAADPFSGARVDPYESLVDESAVWQRVQTLSSILAAFRARYMPIATSPVIDGGDPADNDSHGRRTDIGAIDADGHDGDRFGRFGVTGDVIFANGFDPA